MVDLSLAFAVAAFAGLLVGIEDRAAGAGAFAAIFSAVFSVLDRRRTRLERERDERRATRLERMVESGRTSSGIDDEAPSQRADSKRIGREPPPAIPRPDGGDAMPALEDELAIVRARLRRPRVDWHHMVPIASVATAVVVVAMVGVFVSDSALLPIPLWFVISGVVVFGSAFWLGRNSVASGFLGSVLLGLTVSSGVALTIGFLIRDYPDVSEVGSMVVVPAVLLASLGGWLGYSTSAQRP